MVFRFLVGTAKWNGFFTSALNLTFSPGRRNSRRPVPVLRMIVRPNPAQVLQRDGG